jgi:hypothetical protein
MGLLEVGKTSDFSTEETLLKESQSREILKYSKGELLWLRI